MMRNFGTSGIATDQEAAAQILRAGSRAQAAVDRRLRLRILPFIEGALQDSQVLRAAAVAAIDRVLDSLAMSTPHVAIDDDGTPYVDAGKRTQRIQADTDGVPAIM